MKAIFWTLFFSLCVTSALQAHTKPRARERGIPFEGTPGPYNAITDVVGVEVGHVSVVHGDGKLTVGKGPARTGVTAILPRGKKGTPVFAGWFSLNGNGEMTGTSWVEESGLLEGPVMITNTHSVGVVRDAVVAWRVRQGKPDSAISLPVVAETWDGYLNDINGFHVKAEHAWEALDKASPGAVAEGNVGGGTGMICYEFKCGIGTSSRKVSIRKQAYTLGTLVQANHGLRHQLVIAGISVGKFFASDLVWSKETGSIIAVVATDAPLLPHQLKRLAKRASLGLARSGAISGDSSGDLFLALSTSNPESGKTHGKAKLEMIPNGDLDPLFGATVESVDEAIVNALVAAETMTGVDGHRANALPNEAIELVKRAQVSPSRRAGAQ